VQAETSLLATCFDLRRMMTLGEFPRSSRKLTRWQCRDGISLETNLHSAMILTEK